MNPENRPYTAPPANYRVLDKEEEPKESVEGTLERFIAQELGNSPFDLELNAASFNYMSKDELHEILDKVLETVSPEKMELIYIASNKSEEIIDFLQLLSYPAAAETGPSARNVLRAGIENGDVNVLTTLLAWLLSNMPTLQTRAYLSKFLHRVAIPDEIFYESDVMPLYTQYEAEIEKFKAVLKRKEALMSKKPLAEVKEDVNLIQQDIDCLRRKIEMAKTKVQRSPNFEEETIGVVRNLRFQKQKQFDLADQEASEFTRERQLAERFEYLKTIYRDLYSSNQCLTIKSLLDRQKQEIVAARDIVEVKLPRCVGHLRRKIKAIKTVITDPPRTVNDLENTKRSFQVVEAECKRLETSLKYHKSQELSKELQITKSKADMAQARRNELIDEFQALEDANEIAKTKLTEKSLEVLGKRQRNEEDHEYIKKLRSKAKIHKEKRAELNAIRKEYSILEQTFESLENDLRSGKMDMKIPEKYTKSHNINKKNLDLRAQLEQESNARRLLDEKKKGTMMEYSEKIMTLNKELDDRKDRLKPLLQMVNSFRKQALILEMEYRKLKQQLLGVQKPESAANLGLEIGNMQEALLSRQLELSMVELDMNFKLLELDRAEGEESNVSRAGNRRSFKERLLGKIVEQERVNRELIQEDGDLERNGQKNEVQAKWWYDLHRLFTFKKSDLKGDAPEFEENGGC